MTSVYRTLLLLVGLACGCTQSLVAQQRPAPGDTIYLPKSPDKVDNSQPPSNLMPKLIGPSPEAASLGKFAQVPVSLYTGTPNISIPLYDLTVGPLQLPIGLSYHASGIKLEEIPSWVGSGWALNAGGVVTRTVRGKPDDQQFYGFLTYRQGRTVPSILQQPDDQRLVTFNSIIEGCADVEPDIFSVNVAGVTAQFMFDWNGAPLLYRTSQKLKITYLTSTSAATQGQIIQWTITDERGTIYTFRDAEQTDEVPSGSLGCLAPQPFFSSWYLSEISDTNGENKILFTYSDYTLKYAWQGGESLRRYIGGSLTCGSGSNFDYSGGSQLYLGGKRIKQITTDNGLVSVSFVAASQPREDNGKLSSESGYNTEFKALSQVIVRNYLGEEIRTFQLEQDYSTGRLTLRKVYTRNNGQNSVPPYQLDYTGTLPALAPYMYSQDHWGFHNGRGNTRLVPSGTAIGPSGLSYYFEGADREPDSTATQQGILTRLTYPTGGYVQFAYEAHKYGIVNFQPVSVSLTGRTGIGLNYIVGPLGNGAIYNTFTTGVSPDDDPTGSQPVRIQVTVTGETIGFPPNARPFAKIYDSQGAEGFSRTLDFGTTDFSTSINVSPGTYTALVGCESCNLSTQADDDIQLVVGYPYVYTATNGVRSRIVGGVRLRSQRVFASSDDPSPQQYNYRYVMSADPGLSSGVIYEKPRYDYIQQVFCPIDPGSPTVETSASYYVRTAQNTLNLALTGGSHVGYREVEVTQGTSGTANGRSNYFYISPYDYPDFGSDAKGVDG